MAKRDEIEHPAHYNQHPSGVECIAVAEHMTFNVGNAIKYLWRAGLKDGADHIDDLRKARWYVEREIQRTSTSTSTSTTKRGTSFEEWARTEEALREELTEKNEVIRQLLAAIPDEFRGEEGEPPWLAIDRLARREAEARHQVVALVTHRPREDHGEIDMSKRCKRCMLARRDHFGMDELCTLGGRGHRFLEA